MAFSDGPSTAISLPPDRAKLVPRPCLVILSGPELGRCLELDREPVEIGRAEDCAVSVDSERVSRRHARVQRILGFYFVTDLESTNGTFVNDEQTPMARLKDGDQIRAGDLLLKFVQNPHEVEYNLTVANLAVVDALTGAFNRQHFDQALAAAVQRARRDGSAFCLALLDLDDFKKLNDSLGHVVGDQVLSHLGQVLRAHLPSGQPLFRVGGEEFAVIMPGTDHATGLQHADQLRRAVEHTPFEAEGARVSVTISVGVAMSGGSESAAELYHTADERLYASKRAGRNRVS